MKKTTLLCALITGLTTSGSVMAEQLLNPQQALSVGYASTDIDTGDDTGNGLIDDPAGINLKYTYQSDDKIGFISSLTYTKSSESYTSDIEVEINYLSLLAGPTYSLSDNLKVYGMAGLARAEIKVSDSSDSASDDESDLALAAGLRVNVTDNIALDLSYEYTDIEEWDFSTLSAGIGFNF
ncbi:MULTISPECIES: Ail/Lom family outer membrane beta-barrel protein [unclassified Vibrio]|uniref:Ail/Lom family outer membrane beta-barrel protein n=1 Tax=Vibrio sp. HB236076 TaxID=3232307 RepID=A0AB39HER0_9VIBR|nr:outer membrane protein [Vibrio sp. HB161653]MDP5254108.1 porin family protein [Vibrio sp. HB161653]